MINNRTVPGYHVSYRTGTADYSSTTVCTDNNCVLFYFYVKNKTADTTFRYTLSLI